jgi:hypothetical protein
MPGGQGKSRYLIPSVSFITWRGRPAVANYANRYIFVLNQCILIFNSNAMFLKAWILMGAAWALGFVAGSNAAAQEAKYQSVFMYNFSKYIKWPDAYTSESFIIGVLGNDAVLGELQEMAATKKMTNGLPIEIKQFATISDIGRCHILFISEDFCGQINQVKDAIANMPVLTVTSKPGMAKKGSIINFVGEGDKIKFELNMGRASERGLMVAGSLASLAILI